MAMSVVRTAAEFWWGPFLNGFCVHLTLPILLLAAALVLWTRAGRSIGIDRLFRHEVDRQAATSPDCRGPDDEILARLGGASRILSQSIRAADHATHQRIGGSQLHMTANRLGLSNTEEVYLGRILTLVAAKL